MQGAGNYGLGQAGLARSGYSARVVRAAIASEALEGADEASAQPNSVDPREIEAEQRLADARKQADTIISEARAQAQSILDNANNEAKRACDMRIAQELLAFTRKLRAEIDTIRPMLARMVIEAVEAIVGMLPDDEIAERMVRRALRDFDASTKAVLYASRADYVFLGQIVGKMQVAGDHSVHSVQVDTDLETGICRIEAAGVSLEIGLGAQLDLLETLLLHEEAQKTSDDVQPTHHSEGEREGLPQKSQTYAPAASRQKSAKEEPQKPATPGVSSGGSSAMRRFAPAEKPAQKIEVEPPRTDAAENGTDTPVVQEPSE